MSTASDSQRMEKIVSLCKRRGFIFQSSEIYGGLNGVWDYGPLGVELKRNLKNYWWRVMVHERNDIVGLDGSILTNSAVLSASGHVDGFSDLLIDCRTCKSRMRLDQLVEKNGVQQCPRCGSKDITDARPFNLMLETRIGSIDPGSESTYAEQFTGLTTGSTVVPEISSPADGFKTDHVFGRQSSDSSASPKRPSGEMVTPVYLRPETAQAIFVQFKNV